MARRVLYTTSEYLDALTLQSNGNLYECKGKEFGLFENAGAAHYDAEWLVEHFKKEGKNIRKPAVYRIVLKRVRAEKDFAQKP